MATPTYGEMRSRAEQLYDEKVKDAVLNGLQVLQNEWGDEWIDKIDCRSLDLRSGAQCVLGQVYGEYDHGCEQLHKDYSTETEWAIQHGFFTKGSENDWDALDTAWHKVLCNG